MSILSVSKNYSFTESLLLSLFVEIRRIAKSERTQFKVTHTEDLEKLQVCVELCKRWEGNFEAHSACLLPEKR
jgi:hypothetical protein